MARGHRDHQAFALARDYPVKGFSDPAVMFAHDHLGPNVYAKV
jgi:hypothetical protein